jgi:hypothetical protein
MSNTCDVCGGGIIAGLEHAYCDGTRTTEPSAERVSELIAELKGFPAAQTIVQLRADLYDERTKLDLLRERLTEACNAIDSFGFRSDEYGGTETLVSCIQDLGQQRDAERTEREELERECARLREALEDYADWWPVYGKIARKALAGEAD